MKELSIGVEIHETEKAIHRYIDSCVGPYFSNGLTGAEGMIMLYIFGHADREIGSQDIINAFRINKSSVSEVLSSLQKKGLIELNQSDGDKRRKTIDLTPEGENLRLRLEKEFLEVNRYVERGFSEEEANQLRSYLERIRVNCGGEGKV